ncbi:MAG: CPBP family intramembrane metalloprotease, partial [Bacteroidales bacterium]|nr:CPBP family intramembrane metalloprotease [Bacteroidales bacterium]
GLFPRWVLGVMLGYLLVWSKSIWLPVFAHFVYNAMGVIVTYLAHKGQVPEELPEFGSHVETIPITIVLTVLCLLLLWKIKREAQLSTEV